MQKYPITPAMLEEIIAGVEMDLHVKRYQNFDELRVYCYRVARMCTRKSTARLSRRSAGTSTRCAMRLN